jgi:hypothetical protein
MKIPTTLKHKPVIISEDYNLIDGRYDKNKTDAQGLSLGLAQWNDRGNVDISAKVWRWTGEKWSRQSEEMPLHRVLDLAILICRSKLYFQNLYHDKNKSYRDYPKLDRIPIQGKALNVAVCTDNSFIEEDIKLFDETLHKDDEIISERLKKLSALLKELEY